MRAPVESWVRLGSWDLTVAGSWDRWVGQGGSAALSSLVSSCAHSHWWVSSQARNSHHLNGVVKINKQDGKNPDLN